MRNSHTTDLIRRTRCRRKRFAEGGREGESRQNQIRPCFGGGEAGKNRRRAWDEGG